MRTILIAAKRLILFAVLFVYSKSYSQQNLVNNPSFEDYTICPNATLNTPPPKNWYLATNFGGSGYCNACSIGNVSSVPYNNYGDNYQWAKTGNAYIASTVLNMPSQNIRYYYQTKLKDSLKKNKNYYCEFYVVFFNSEKLKCNNISALLTKTAVYVDTVATPYGVLYANAQIYNYGNPIITDTLNWVKVSGIYKAEGGEQYLTLGNFKDDAHTNYFASQPTGYNGAAIMIDDVSVIPLDSMPLQADAGRDTTISIGDSVFIGSYTNGIDTIQWQEQNTGNIIDSTRPGFWVYTLTNTCYVLTQTVNGYTSSDTVCITVKPLPLKFISYSLSLRGTKQSQSVENLWTTANEVNVSHFNIQRSINGRDFTTIGKVVAKNKSYNEYSFMDNGQPSTVDSRLYYRIESVDKDGYKDYSEVRQIAMSNGQLAISVYPNPAKDFITIDCKGAKEFKIIDYLGRVVTHKKIINYQLSIINIQDFAKGMYIVQIATDKGEVLNKKLLVE